MGECIKHDWIQANMPGYQICYNCKIERKRPADPLSPARVEATARKYCEILGLDADGIHIVCGPTISEVRWEGTTWMRYEQQAREFIAMQLAYERTKG